MVLSVSVPDEPADQSADPMPNGSYSAPVAASNETPAAQPSITPLAGADVQSTLLALLSKAASAVGMNGLASG